MNLKIAEVCKTLETLAPLSLQESYDNSGLLIGSADQTINAALLTLDVTEAVIDEAIENHCQLIIAHHPLIFGRLNRITDQNWVQRCITKAIRHNIAIYAIHTNLDNILKSGVNEYLANLLKLNEVRILQPSTGMLCKLVTFAPLVHAESVRTALFHAGAGHIGEYDACSFSSRGIGSYRASENANPYLGDKGTLHREEEEKIEVIFPKWKTNGILNAMREHHPYEEVAYDLYSLENSCNDYGAGAIGTLEKEMNTNEFLKHLKQALDLELIRFAGPQKSIQKVALCGGSGSFLLQQAMNAEADILITGDFKYHQFFEHENRIAIADIGHHESEKHVPSLLQQILSENFPNFALLLSKVNTNPIQYFY